jgi:hypothetical protein
MNYTSYLEKNSIDCKIVSVNISMLCIKEFSSFYKSSWKYLGRTMYWITIVITVKLNIIIIEIIITTIILHWI